MPHIFSKYNLSSDYETFIYYDEVDGTYIQFMYAGYTGENKYEILSETFHTNTTDIVTEQTRVKLREHVDQAILNIPTYIGELLIAHKP